MSVVEFHGGQISHRYLMNQSRHDIARLAMEFLARAERAEKLIHVPGVWRCPKCPFRLVQANLNMADGTVTARDEAGDKCPNCNGPMWRVSERDERVELQNELERLVLLNNTPELLDFWEGAKREAVHQRERWGAAHDENKHPHDWIAVIVHLAGKAVKAFWDGNRDKMLHHIITVAAVAANWHAREVKSG